jgi:hypothetical protein
MILILSNGAHAGGKKVLKKKRREGGMNNVKRMKVEEEGQ